MPIQKKIIIKVGSGKSFKVVPASMSATVPPLMKDGFYDCLHRRQKKCNSADVCKREIRIIPSRLLSEVGLDLCYLNTEKWTS